MNRGERQAIAEEASVPRRHRAGTVMVVTGWDASRAGLHDTARAATTSRK
jgi:hypothetical protein